MGVSAKVEIGCKSKNIFCYQHAAYVKPEKPDIIIIDLGEGF